MDNPQEQAGEQTVRNPPELDPDLAEMARHVRIGGQGDFLDDDGNYAFTGTVIGVRVKDDGSGLEVELLVPEGMVQKVYPTVIPARDPQYLYEDGR